MSADAPTRRPAARERAQSDRTLRDWLGPRPLALLSALALVFSFAYALYGIVDVVGDPGTLLAVVLLVLLAGTGLSAVLGERTALLIGAVVLAGGLWVYASALPADLVVDFGQVLDDVFAMLTGLSVLRLQKIELWVLAIAPAPTFLTWYLALRRRYVAAVGVGGATLCFLILTGDVDATVALVGAVGAVGTVGFGRLANYGGDLASAEWVAILLAGVVVLTSVVSVVPGGAGQPLALFGAGGAGTVEGNLVGSSQRVTVQGAISLSPDVRFTVHADEPAYWRVGAFDRYTGDGWVRTGGTVAYPGRLADPPGRAATLTQRVVVESRLAAMPAAWKPVSVGGDAAGRTQVTDLSGVRPDRAFSSGATYTVESRRPRATSTELNRAGTDYPEGIVDRYTQLPASTPDRVARKTDRILERAGARTPYERARAIERWLQRNRGYSLDVTRPDGDVAAAFLFDMREGYCTYFATTMVTMLRTQGVPARFVVGYTSGEHSGPDEWTVRGLDSHAWVEVYFPGVGWRKFDPTPAEPRIAAENAQLDDAGGANGSSGTPTPTPTPTSGTDARTATPTTDDTTTSGPGETTPGGPTAATPTAPPTTTRANATGGLPLPEPPSRQEFLLGAVVLAGALAGARRLGLGERAYRAVWLRWQPRADPASDLERAAARLEFVLAREHRPRRPGETRRQYLAAVNADERVRAVFDAVERARYAGEAREAVAADVVGRVDDLVRERAGLGRL
ncbi:MAG: transglutaminaseTgpA domain-containing protein [Haloarculaceae archaeon]